MRLLVLIFLLVASAGPAAAQAVREVPVGQHVDWANRAGAPTRYRSGGISVSIRARPAADIPDLLEPVVTVDFGGGLPPAQLTGVPTSPGTEHRFAVGNGPSGRFLFFQSFSGGAHCCTGMKLVYRDGAGLRTVDFGDWDGGVIDQLPADIDGDGNLDLVMTDNRFLYAFSSYAASLAPPRIMSVIAGAAVDVSDRPAFRSYFRRAMEDARSECTTRGAGNEANGACAAYVASAARLGRFDEAWRVMLGAYDRNADWPYVGECRVPLVGNECPGNDFVEYDNFPDALRHLLVSAGYVARERAR